MKATAVIHILKTTEHTKRDGGLNSIISMKHQLAYSPPHTFQ